MANIDAGALRELLAKALEAAGFSAGNAAALARQTVLAHDIERKRR